MAKLESLTKLHTIQMEGNPVWSHSDYSNYVVSSLPHLKVLDQQEISAEISEVEIKEYEFQRQSEVDGVKLKLVGRPGGQPAQPEELEKAFEHDGGEKEKTMREKHQDGNF